MTIRESFDEVLKYSQEYDFEPETDEIFSEWEKNKKHFVDRFGGLIYEYSEPVTFELGPKEKHERVLQFANKVYQIYGYYDLSRFIEKQEEGFFNNITIADAVGWDGKPIPKGTKLVKSFKHFIKDGRSLADLQNEASRLIQEDKVNGTLCLSVHPLDFLSLSENTYNWISCHSLDGEYRAGNLSYMMDDCTFVCYLKGEEEAKLPNFGPNVRWNSKKWRVLLYESQDRTLLMAGRQYPFASTSGLDLILKKVLPKAGFCLGDWTGWNGNLITDVTFKDGLNVKYQFPYIPIGKGLMPLNKIVVDNPFATHYNDLLYSSCYKPLFAFEKYKPLLGSVYPKTNSSSIMEVGRAVDCLYCGSRIVSRGSNTCLCDVCEIDHGRLDNPDISNCDICGVRGYIDDLHWLEDVYVCQDCLDKYYTKCNECDEYISNEEIRYDEIRGQYLCPECLGEMEEGY